MGKDNCVYFLLTALFSLFNLSCTCKTHEIKRLDFLDSQSQTYNIMDTLKTNPFDTKYIYFLIDETNIDCINYKQIEEYLKNNSMVQKQIHEKFAMLGTIFFKKSTNTDNLIKYKSKKMLTLCNDDKVVEFFWRQGVLSDTFYYKNGRIKGSENVQLK